MKECMIKGPILSNLMLDKQQTLQLQGSDKFRRLLQWGLANGLLLKDVEFPASFAPLGYTGIAARQDIPERTVFMAVPFKLIISLDTVYRQQELLPLIKDNESVLGPKSDPDNEFNLLTFFILVEKLKGADSFYEPYLSSLPAENFTAADWPEELFRLSKNEDLLQERNYLRNSMDQTFDVLYSRLFSKHPMFASHGLDRPAFKQLFEWAAGVVMTRSYGWSLPSTCLVPFADMCNHSAQDSTTHFLVHREVEGGAPKQGKVLEQYRQKRQYLDFEVFGTRFARKEGKPVRSRLDKFLSQRKLQFLQDLLPKHAIVEAKVFNEVETGVADLKNLTFLTSSCTEDNDTDQAEQEQYLKVVKEMSAQELARLEKREDLCAEGFEPNPFYGGRVGHQEERLEEFESDKVSEESDYDWVAECEEKEVFFALTTQKMVRKGEELFNCYGKRNSRFLLMWYGFALEQNPYDSLCFRIWMDYFVKDQSLEELPQEILYFGWYPGLTGQKYTTFRGRTCEVRELSREIRLKQDVICMDLLAFLRVFLLSYWGSPHKPLALYPSSYSYEIYVLQFYRLILLFVKQRLPPLLPEDSPKAYFFNCITKTNMRLAESQLQVNEAALELLLLLRNKEPLHRACSSLGRSKQENIRRLRMLRPYVSSLAQVTLLYE